MRGDYSPLQPAAPSETSSKTVETSLKPAETTKPVESPSKPVEPLTRPVETLTKPAESSTRPSESVRKSSERSSSIADVVSRFAAKEEQSSRFSFAITPQMALPTVINEYALVHVTKSEKQMPKEDSNKLHVAYTVRYP